MSRIGPAAMRPAHCLLPLLLLVAACGEEGSFELHWTIGCTKTGDPGCQIQSVIACSSVGLDSVEVFARQGADESRALFPCYSPAEGPMGRGPGLDQGRTTLHILGLSPGGQQLTSPLDREVEIPAEGYVRVDVDLPIPPACQDGVDNDGDGLVDLQDPSCKSASGTAE